MSTNVVNQAPYLRTSREFPEDLPKLTQEIIKTYIDIANAVNNRTIGLFSKNVPSITGESWFILNNQRQQTLRQIYTFTTTAAINHGINGASGIDPSMFTSCYGSFTDGTNGYGLIWGTAGAIPNQISFYLTRTQIIFVVGAGAPALTSGRIVLTWLSAV